MTDEVAATLGALLRRAAELTPRAPLLVGAERSTFAAVDAGADSWAQRLLASGVHPGEHVGVLLEPCVEYITVMFAIARIGATIVPISDRFKASELSYVVAHADLTALVTAESRSSFLDFPALLRRALPELDRQDWAAPRLAGAPRLRCVLLLDDPTDNASSDEARDHLPDGERSSEILALESRVTPLANAFLMYTSGTSANPKGCLLNHRSFVMQGAAIAHERYMLQPGDAFWCPLPLFHNGGICTLLACLSSGAGYIHCGRFEPGRAVEQLERERCTHAIPTFETIWLPVLEDSAFASADINALRVTLNAGTPESLRQMQARLPCVVQLSNYGCTEAAGHLTMSRLTDSLEVRTLTCGEPLPGMQVRVVDPDSGEELASDTEGEIQFRGPMRFAGYYKASPELAGAVDPDGWFRSGDLGALDAAGRLRFVGRLKDMLKVGGENVAAAEVEAFLLVHPAIRIAQVVGVPDARYTEVPAAFVELNSGHTLSEQELIEHCLDEIATFKIPRYVRFVTDWPMSGTKIKKFVLRARLVEELRVARIREAPRISTRR